VARLQAFLVSQGVWNAQREQALVGECQAEVQRAVEAFEATPMPPAEARSSMSTANGRRPWPSSANGCASAPRGGRWTMSEKPAMSEKKVSLLEAVNLALHRAMAEDDNVVLLGEDIGVNGGVFRATAGLREAFGFKRVIDTPLAETMIAGLGVGMAAQGLKPVLEIQITDCP